ncbi:hypothetical protein [Mycobacterium riyadhense]|uniref:hypothetical protein n=1 Tax=Mycobacterium riyadhense TaxID=486698 RepID=UPI00195B677D|nr:hypothetical protein [Mycobacterium riyadhense]
MLTAAGALAPRDEELTRTGQWLDDILHTVEPDTARRQLRGYATWQVMRRLRVSAARAARHAATPATPDATSAPPPSSSPGCTPATAP